MNGIATVKREPEYLSHFHARRDFRIFDYEIYYDRLSGRLDGAGSWDIFYHPVGTAGAGQQRSISGGSWTDGNLEFTYDYTDRLKTRKVKTNNTFTEHSMAWVYDAVVVTFSRQSGGRIGD